MLHDKHSAMTVLSFGAGQDSTYILYRIIRDEAFRLRWVAGDFIVVMSNTGNEHPHTYRHVRFIRSLCREHGIPFYLLDASMGYHPRTWKSLIHQFKRNNTIMSMMFPRTCTDNLKIKPIYNFLDHYIARRYFGYTSSVPPKGKNYIKRFAVEYGTVRVILGIAKGEEKRIAKVSRKTLKAAQLSLFAGRPKKEPVWFSNAIRRAYPLVAEAIDRKECQRYIRQIGWPLPYPSNCVFCPFISLQEVLWLRRNLPDMWKEWVALEKAKIDRCCGIDRNYGVKGERLLTEVLAEAEQEFGHMTDRELDEYKMSHGHCVMSAF